MVRDPAPASHEGAGKPGGTLRHAVMLGKPILPLCQKRQVRFLLEDPRSRQRRHSRTFVIGCAATELQAVQFPNRPWSVRRQAVSRRIAESRGLRGGFRHRLRRSWMLDRVPDHFLERGDWNGIRAADAEAALAGLDGRIPGLRCLDGLRTFAKGAAPRRPMNLGTKPSTAEHASVPHQWGGQAPECAALPGAEHTSK